jgi:hypothetical protein
MREYQQKHLIRTVLYSRVTIVVLFLLIVLLLRSIMELNDKRIAVKKLEAASAQEKADLQQKVAKAKADNEAIATPRGFETYVRTTQPVVKNGEGVIVIYDTPTSPVAPVKSDMTIWERISLYLQVIFAKK